MNRRTGSPRIVKAVELDERIVRPEYIRQHEAPVWAYNLAGELVDKMMPSYQGRDLPAIVLVPPDPRPEKFAGRHYPRQNVIAISSPDPKVQRALVIHEMTHWMRKRSGDPQGKHDKDFYVLVERGYKRFHVPTEVARFVEQICNDRGSYCYHW